MELTQRAKPRIRVWQDTKYRCEFTHNTHMFSVRSNNAGAALRPQPQGCELWPPEQLLIKGKQDDKSIPPSIFSVSLIKNTSPLTFFLFKLFKLLTLGMESLA